MPVAVLTVTAGLTEPSASAGRWRAPNTDGPGPARGRATPARSRRLRAEADPRRPGAGGGAIEADEQLAVAREGDARVVGVLAVRGHVEVLASTGGRARGGAVDDPGTVAVGRVAARRA